jgi:hypothetical protein
MTLAWRASDTGSTGRVARIRSDAAYRALGIAPGDNYVWIDRLDSRARHMIVPADTSYPISVFVVRPDSHRPDGDPMRLRLLNDDASSDGSPPRDPRPPAPGERDSVHVFLCWKCKAVAATTYESTRTVVKADSATSWCSTGRTAIVKSDGSSDTPIKAMQAYFESAGIRWRRGSDVVVP